ATSVNGERSLGDAWFTLAIEFERAAGWDREQAEEWTQGHLGLRDLGRSALLEVPQGIEPGLATFLGDVLFAGEYRLDTSNAARPAWAPVEFIPVPPLPRAKRGERQRPRLPSGAGLETDLADLRHRDRLPSALRDRLGDAPGIVNFLEAQAVVRALTRLARECRTGSLHRPGSANRALDRTNLPHSSIGVLALYPAQAQLIRLLLEPEAESLASGGTYVFVDVADTAQERVYDIACVSLTRSHTHRATSFGSGPEALATALTRGRSRLLLFGDPGTMGRRSEWHAALDHLDEVVSARERAVIAR